MTESLYLKYPTIPELDTSDSESGVLVGAVPLPVMGRRAASSVGSQVGAGLAEGETVPEAFNRPIKNIETGIAYISRAPNPTIQAARVREVAGTVAFNSWMTLTSDIGSGLSGASINVAANEWRQQMAYDTYIEEFKPGLFSRRQPLSYESWKKAEECSKLRASLMSKSLSSEDQNIGKNPGSSKNGAGNNPVRFGPKPVTVKVNIDGSFNSPHAGHGVHVNGVNPIPVNAGKRPFWSPLYKVGKSFSASSSPSSAFIIIQPQRQQDVFVSNYNSTIQPIDFDLISIILVLAIFVKISQKKLRQINNVLDIALVEYDNNYVYECYYNY